ncbi:GLUG motif-containing protein [Parabacteroides bouchesdurhonensis]|uniref:GLUG motif-containing protein n=1 Tax=Parabacteroides bouchesdurhonensis TaxID=1936995 RepID=UPI000E51724B|nr:GLUG motif-containing protein [Parabacteroides bouchesdurhonensis]RHJ95361.1 hypothetical protein DW095_02795 [Bacteroides sp. AM07-16]
MSTANTIALLNELTKDVKNDCCLTAKVLSPPACPTSKRGRKYVTRHHNIIMKITYLILTGLFFFLSLAIPAQAQGLGPNPADTTYWKDQLAGVSVGSSTENPADVAWSTTITGTNTDTTYTVKTALGLAWIARITNNDSVYQAEGTGYQTLYPHRKGFEGCTVELDFTADSLSLRDHYWTPIGDNINHSFNGAFDGNHKLVAGLKADTTVIGQYSVEAAFVGLFGYIYNASVSNVGVWVAAEGITGSSNKYSYAGGIAGYIDKSTIRNCFVAGDAGATITGKGSSCYVGGIVGINKRETVVENCYATVDVYASGSSSATGGIAGTNEQNASITSVYATGNVTGISSSSSCSVGGITGTNSGALSKVLALNKDSLSASVTGTDKLYLGRISGKNAFSYQATFSQCYASTNIKLVPKGATREDNYFDGTDASVSSDFSELFPTTGGTPAWATNGSTDNLPKLSGGFKDADASAGAPGQPALARADYLAALPRGTEGNPFVINLATSISSGDNENKYDYSEGLITLLEPDSCYLIKNKATGSDICTVTFKTDNVDDTDTCRIYARGGCTLDTLLIPTNITCVILGDSLRSKSCQVKGNLITDVPVVLEMPEETSSGTDYRLSSSLYIDGGSVTVNDTLRAYASGRSGYGIYSDGNYTFTIGEKSVVYAYGEFRGCFLDDKGSVDIKDGGILRAAGIGDAIYVGNSITLPALHWKFSYVQDSACLTLKEKGSDVPFATFSKKEFSNWFAEATCFAAPVKSDVTYNLYMEGNPTPLEGRPFNEITAFTHEFTAPGNSVQLYTYVGLPMEAFTNDVDSIILTDNCAYKKDKEAVKHFNNVLSGRMKQLHVTGKLTKVLLNGVTITDSLLVKTKGGATFYLLQPENNAANALGHIRVEQDGSLTFMAGGGGTASATDFVNSGTFTDHTGLVEQVKASITPGDTFTVKRPSIEGTPEVAPGGTVTLTAVGSSTQLQTRSGSGTGPAYSYTWLEWKEGSWKGMSPAQTSANVTVGKGTYRCRVKYTLQGSDGINDVYVETTLISLPVEVKEKSTPPYIPPPPPVTVPTSNAEVAPDAACVWLADGLLHIRTPQAADMHIYTFGGNLLHSARIPVGDTTIQAPDSPCIVLIGKQRFKFAPR